MPSQTAELNAPCSGATEGELQPGKECLLNRKGAPVGTILLNTVTERLHKAQMSNESTTRTCLTQTGPSGAFICNFAVFAIGEAACRSAGDAPQTVCHEATSDSVRKESAETVHSEP